MDPHLTVNLSDFKLKNAEYFLANRGGGTQKKLSIPQWLRITHG